MIYGWLLAQLLLHHFTAELSVLPEEVSLYSLSLTFLCCSAVVCLSERSSGQFLWEAERERPPVHAGHGEDHDFYTKDSNMK